MRHVERLFLLVALASCGGGGDSASAPAPAPAPVPAPSPAAATCGIADFRAETLRLLNARRAAGANCRTGGTFGPAPAVQWNERIEAAAAGHALDMAEHDYFEHEGRDGANVPQRVSAEGYNWSTVGENIAAGQQTIPQVIDGWMASDSHCVNMMDPRFRDIGMACASNADSTYGRYWVLDLAAPR
jgi:uncharacterized protein YkwD